MLHQRHNNNCVQRLLKQVEETTIHYTMIISTINKTIVISGDPKRYKLVVVIKYLLITLISHKLFSYGRRKDQVTKSRTFKTTKRPIITFTTDSTGRPK